MATPTNTAAASHAPLSSESARTFAQNALSANAKPAPSTTAIESAPRRLRNTSGASAISATMAIGTSTSAPSTCVTSRLGAASVRITMPTTMQLTATISRRPTRSCSMRAPRKSSTRSPAASAGCTAVSGAQRLATVWSGNASAPSAAPSSQRGRLRSRAISESRRPCSSGTSRASLAWMTIAALNSTEANAASATPATTEPIDVNHDGSVSGEVIFHYDVGSPWCWLAGERMTHVLGLVPVWQPVLIGPGEVDRAAVDAAAAAQGLPPPRWPDRFPFDSELAMRAATFAKQGGRAVAFSLAAMRQAFAGGRDLSVTENVLIAAAACELHPRAVLKGVETASVRNALRDATAAAAAAGVREVPAIPLGGRVFSGPAAVEDAAAALT